VSGWRLLLGRLDPAARERDRAGLGRILLRLTELGTEPDEDRGDVLIRPPIEEFGIADFSAFDRLVTLGHEAGGRALEAWLSASPISGSS
jgi:hypothetical protein